MAGPPVIEGALKNTIHALAFGLIVATLAVNFGKYFIPNFFPYMVGIVIAIEVVLFSFDKPKEIYDKFQSPGIRGSHTIEGAGSPQITVSAPGEEPEGSPRKRDRIRDKLKTKKDQKGRRESGVPASPTVSGSPARHSLVPPPSPGQEAMDGRETEHEKGKDKSEKERKKEEEKAKKKEKEEEKERQKAEKKEQKEKGKEEDAEKGEKGTWRKRKGAKQDSV